MNGANVQSLPSLRARLRGRGPLLQWHITDRCNLRCAHCYQESYGRDELPLARLSEILDQYHALLDSWGDGGTAKGHVSVTGGEPFARADFLDLLELLAQNHQRHSFGILTNGTFINEAMARRLREYGPAFVQVSIEGTQKAHDRIRGKGNYERTVEAIRLLVRQRIRVFISFTAHRENYEEFAQVARLGRRMRVAKVWADRLIPSGSGAQLQRDVLTPDETRRVFEVMQQARHQAERSMGNRTDISMHRALQFLVGGGKPYRCSAGDTLLTVLPNGDLLPCRRMPIRVGNLLQDSMLQLYYGSDVLRSLRDRNRVANDCQGCFYSKLCGGGLRCLSYAVTGDAMAADPGCWRRTTATESTEAARLAG